MNRGLARRAVFENRECVRYFLSCLARVVRGGLLEVHAYCVMTTHFHLLVVSPGAELSRGMQLAQNRYVRWFNRRVQRDGPLFRGRFRSRHVDSLEYRRALVRYIDHNPVAARMVAAPELYPYGSARHHRESRGPLWLERRWIEEVVTRGGNAARFTPEAYRRHFGVQPSEAMGELIEARLGSNARDSDPLDDLIRSAPAGVAAWMRRKAELADGTRPGLPCAAGRSVVHHWRLARSAAPEWRLVRGRTDMKVWPVMLVGLLRDLAGARWAEIERRTDTSASGVRRRYETHRVWLAEFAAYAEKVGEVGASSVRV